MDAGRSREAAGRDAVRGGTVKGRTFHRLLMVPAVVACMAWSGCSLVHMVDRYGIEAVLVDCRSEEPIGRSKVTVRIDDVNRVTRTSASGRLRVPPERDWHLSWLGGPAYASDPEARIGISAPGFEPEAILWHRVPDRDGDPDFEESDGVIDLGRIRMQPRHRE